MATTPRALFGDPDRDIDERPEVQELFQNLRVSVSELEALLEQSGSHWGYEDSVYRFYHQSFKVYGLQRATTAIPRWWLPSRRLLPIENSTTGS